MARPLLGRFQRRLSVAFCLTLLASTAALGALLTRAFKARLVAELTRGLTVEAELAADLIRRRPPTRGETQALARELGKRCGCRMTIITRDGMVLGDSDVSDVRLASLENHAERPEVRVALAGGEGASIRHSATLGVDLLYTAVPLPGFGVLRAALPLTEVNRQAAEVRATIAAICVFTLLAAVLLALWLSRTLAQPLEDIARLARRLSDGDYAARVRLAPDDEHGRLAEALNSLGAKVQETEKVRRDFVANVSHELRTPLASIRAFAETLRDGAIDDKENRLEFVEAIEKDAERLSALVEDLLDLSAIESGKRQPALAAVSVLEVAREAAASLRPLAERRGVRLEIGDAPGLPMARADRGQIKQVLANLLDNAVKFNREGGSARVTARADATSLVVEVADSGPGVPAEDLPRLFERFYRVDKARSREVGGTGLGLSIVKHIVEAHGGTVSVDSRLDQGSTFRFTLPLA